MDSIAEEPIAEPEDAVEDVGDPSEYTQKQRLRMVLKGLNHYLTRRANAHNGYFEGQLSSQERDRIMRAALEELIMVVEPVMRRYGGEEYLDEKHIGTVHGPADAALDINGLLEFLNQPEFIAFEINTPVDDPIEGRQQQTDVEHHTIDSRIVDSGYRTIEQFLDECGLGLDPEDVREVSQY